MNLYHEASASKLESILTHGLKCESRGDKGNDQAIIKTDEFLDANRPLALRNAGLSRCEAIYAYIGTNTTLIDIRTGQIVPLKQHAQKNGTALVELRVDPHTCFVSDLDKFDAVKTAVESGHTTALSKLAAQYWQSVTPLSGFRPGSVPRPEIMISRDVPPEQIIPLQ